jgi:hypothetical protein
MKVFFDVRSVVKLAAFFLLAGFLLGFHLGTSYAAGPAPAGTTSTEVLDFRPPQPAGPRTGEEVLTWSRTPTSSWSFSDGSSA